jgi:hypothetical protein
MIFSTMLSPAWYLLDKALITPVYPLLVVVAAAASRQGKPPLPALHLLASGVPAARRDRAAVQAHITGREFRVHDGHINTEQAVLVRT